jgi:chromosome segregation ATPase
MSPCPLLTLSGHRRSPAIKRWLRGSSESQATIGDSDSRASSQFRARNDAFDLAFNWKGSIVKFIEPAFDAGGELWPTLSNVPDTDISALENTIANQSAELNLRLTEVAELYNVLQQHANKLQIACEEIDRLNQTIRALQETATRHKTDFAAARDRITLLENEKVALRTQLDKALHESNTLAGRLLTMEAALNVRETNVTSALEQVEFLNSELATAAAERFKLVAAVQGEKRRQRTVLNQQTSILEDKIKRTEALAATQGMQIKHLETVRGKLDKRVQVLEALLRDEQEVAELKIKRLTEELERNHLDHSVAEGH